MVPIRSLIMVLGSCVLVGCAAALDGARGGKPWRDTFPIDRGALSPSGAAPYLALRPGDAWTYRDGPATLTIRVLDDTEVIDGVTTRVIEEREESGGQIKEVSRNFFAVDPATRDLYYFGEEVDIYSNEQVVTHEGAWRSGAGGARFGLFLPGVPALGDRYYQEVAPGVAMDRVEIVSVDERVDTPAGLFEHCVHLRETTPMERGSGNKWFAPGVGMVKDGGMVLVSYHLAGGAR